MAKKLESYDSGMVREPKGHKVDYTLAIDGPMFKRYAIHMSNGARVHGARNWMKASGEQELRDFLAGAFRHMVQYLNGETDEDHAAAVIFNLNGAELCKEKLHAQSLADAEKAKASAHRDDAVAYYRKILSGNND